MDRAYRELRDAAEAAQALQDSYGALVALQLTEMHLVRAQGARSKGQADIGSDEQRRAVAALSYVIVELRDAEAQATSAQAITWLGHVIVELRAVTAPGAAAQAIASVRQAISALRWLAGERETSVLASGFVKGRGDPPARRVPAHPGPSALIRLLGARRRPQPGPD